MSASSHMGPQAASADLRRAAESWGIEPEFWDIWGNHHSASAQTITAILKALGVDAGSPEALVRALQERSAGKWSRLLPPTLVVSESAQPPLLPVSVPADKVHATITLDIWLEDGGRQHSEVTLADAAVTEEASLGGKRLFRKQVALPRGLPLGYHEIEARIGNDLRGECRLIVAPDRAYAPRSIHDAGIAGVGVSVYSLRSERNWGCGDFTDLRSFIEWAAAETGASYVALNPLHDIPNRQPYNASPYLPNCSFYRNAIYLDVEAIEDFGHSRCAQALLASERVQQQLRELRDAETVQYERVYRVKRAFLKALFRTFLNEYRAGAPRAQEFREYAEREGALLDAYATHAALDEVIHKRSPDVWNWRSWPVEYQDPGSPAVREFAQQHWRLVLFYKYIQWQLDRQLAEAHRHALDQGLAIGLYHDLALATDRFGCDLWAHGPFYVAGARVGSPPDNFSPKGQDWSFPPPNAQAHFEDGYRLFRESIRKNSSHGGALRIDHVMRFFRLYWIPDTLDASQGTYVQDRYEDLIRVLALESVRQKFVIVGEDLGTVPDYIRENLARFGILSYRLFYFEQDKSGRFKHPGEYPPQSLVSASTHDLPTLAGFWQNRDIDARRDAGILPDEGAYRRALDERGKEKQKMLNLLGELNLLPPSCSRNQGDYPELTGELHSAITGFLAQTPSRFFLLSQEDLFKDVEQQNLPGTTSEHPNWSRKMKFTVEQLRAGGQPDDYAAMLRGWVKRTGRWRRG